MLAQIAKDNTKFYMTWGKTNENKFYLVKWEIVRYIQNHIGLGIEDLKLMNLDTMVKILWRQVYVKREWWKKVMQNKYFKSFREICIDLFRLELM